METLIQFLKAHYKTIIQIVFGLFILYYLIFFLTPKVKMSAEQRHQLDSLNVKIKQLREDNLKLENQISDFSQQMSEIDKHIDKIKGQKTLIKEYYHEKINSVDKFTSPEIDSFFSNRYR